MLAVAGTKEALFLIAQAIMPDAKAGARPAILLPNPLYNVYLGAAVMAGAEPVLLSATAATGHLPDLDRLSPALLARTVAFYLCSPSNPQGAAADLAYLTRALELARRHDFLLIADECYAEIYTREPPAGALQAAMRLGGRAWTICWSATPCPSARALPACARASSPAIRRSWPALPACAAMPPRSSPCRWRRPRPRSGATRRMSRRTARSTAKNSTSPSSASAGGSASTVRMAASSSG